MHTKINARLREVRQSTSSEIRRRIDSAYNKLKTINGTQ